MHHDIIVIGGSYAGMAAALQLLRARRSVLVIDAGQRRNRTAHHAHGFLGQDGVPPGTIAATARQQLSAYPTLTWLDAHALTATGSLDVFRVTTSDGGTHQGRRILLATGVADQLPAVDGLAERWGTAVFHCPYCHGYELDQGRIGIVGAGPLSVHQAELLTEWGNVTLLVNGALQLDDAARALLSGRGVAIEEAPIDRIEGHADVVLADGRRLVFAAVTATRTHPVLSPGRGHGLVLEETPMATKVRIEQGTMEQTHTHRQIFACGRPTNRTDRA
ncbi:NAD(P)/FAD-dependent oxidoreductase [Xanthomonas sacchari]|uniref:NAD(P)/FAD-dependent oxidoreductase n=1 Tax=Xanthomonas sacchari TaxID=56458 RepID=UPI0009E52AD7|nr:NAD(P)/FAD-dependent oxidoreductase [Xanthomonas sacchari]